MSSKTWVGARCASPESLALAGAQAVVFARPSPERADDESNEDSAAVLEVAGAAVLVVADGLGGHRGGADASARVVRDLVKAAQRSKHPSEIVTRIVGSLEKTNAELVAKSSGSTTVLVAVIESDSLRCVHVGDSDLLVVGQRGAHKLQTISHSPVGYALESGLLEPEEARDHEQRHIVSNYVGRSPLRIEITTGVELAARDTLVLASDGLWDNLAVDEVNDHVRSGPLEEAAAALVKQATHRMAGEDPAFRGKPDDLAFVLFRR